MIKASELRIGNLIQIELYKGQAFGPEILEDVIKETVKVDPNIIGCVAEGAEHYFPIPLTPEILLKAGFKGLPHFTVQGSLQFNIGRGRVISIGCVGTPNEMVFLTEEEPPNVKTVIVLRNFDYDGKTYLHQIQNIIHSLTGEELEINI